MTKTSSPLSTRRIDKSLLIVDRENPLDTLPFISDALISMATLLQPGSIMNTTIQTKAGTGLILDLLAYAIEDVQEALEAGYRKTAKAEIDKS